MQRRNWIVDVEIFLRNTKLEAGNVFAKLLRNILEKQNSHFQNINPESIGKYLLRQQQQQQQ